VEDRPEGRAGGQVDGGHRRRLVDRGPQVADHDDDAIARHAAVAAPVAADFEADRIAAA
jgi:hypothetical protein